MSWTSCLTQASDYEETAATLAGMSVVLRRRHFVVHAVELAHARVFEHVATCPCGGPMNLSRLSPSDSRLEPAVWSCKSRSSMPTEATLVGASAGRCTQERAAHAEGLSRDNGC